MNIICVFLFPLLYLCETFLVLRRCERDIITNVDRCSAGLSGRRGLRRRYAAARVLRLWFGIPPVAGMFSVVSVVCCQVEVSARG